MYMRLLTYIKHTNIASYIEKKGLSKFYLLICIKNATLHGHI